ncbi:MAG: EAL domain-containing protein [Actinomycetota bacterium]
MQRSLAEQTRQRKALLPSTQELQPASSEWWNLHESLQLLATVIDHAPMILYALDVEGRFLLSEGRRLERLGLKPGELVGQSIFESDRQDSDLIKNIQRVLTGEEVAWIGRAGEWIYEIRATPVYSDRGQVVGVIAIATDLAESIKADAELKIRARQQAAVAELGQSALAGTELPALLDEAVQLIARTLEVEYCQLWELQPDGISLRLISGVGWQQGLVGHVILSSESDTQAHYTLLVNEPVILADLQTETRFAGSPLLHAHGVRSGISAIVPQSAKKLSALAAETEIQESPNLESSSLPITTSHPLNFGVLVAHSTSQRQFTQDDIHFLQAIANLLAQAIERHRSEEQMRLLASAVHYAQDSILITTTQLKQPGPEIVFVNPAFTKMTGYTAAEVIGKTPRILQGPKTESAVLERLRYNLTHGEVFYGEAINYRKDGTEFYNGWHIEPIHDSHGEISHYLAIQRDISDRKRTEETLLHAAFHDALTGLPNRALFMRRLQEVMAEAKQSSDQQFAVLFLDLDRFKVINDSLGHQAGDQLLTEIARRLQACMSPVDMVARFGGDEFAILLCQTECRWEPVAGKETASDKSNFQSSRRFIYYVRTAIERIQTELHKPVVLGSNEVFTSASIGIAFSDGGRHKAEISMLSPDYNQILPVLAWQCDQPQELLRAADIAMYRAKAKGGARFAVFNQTMHDQAVIRLQLENDLRRAIDRQELCLYYQPIIDLGTDRITGFEALVRWQHPERGLISPNEFIPIAEETGLIIPLGWWVLREATHQLRLWQAQFPSHRRLMMSVNLSGKQFMQMDLIERVDEILRERECFGSPCSQDIRGSLKLEITESAIMENADMAISMLGHLKALGVQLAIDDFGTGYSSLNRLYHFPIDTLKIDRSFVSCMALDREKAEIVRAVVSLAHSLGMDVTAEGIEVSEQLEMLKELQCEQGQGYLFSKPVDRTAATAILAGR